MDGTWPCVACMGRRAELVLGERESLVFPSLSPKRPPLSVSVHPSSSPPRQAQRGLNSLGKCSFVSCLKRLGDLWAEYSILQRALGMSSEMSARVPTGILNYRPGTFPSPMAAPGALCSTVNVSLLLSLSISQQVTTTPPSMASTSITGPRTVTTTVTTRRTWWKVRNASV